MSTENRGGQTLKAGLVGRCNVLRQQVLMPGETVNISINGKVQMESLRERDNLRLNAHLGVFMTPMRWLDSGWPDYIKGGPEGSGSVDFEQVSDLAALGIGAWEETSRAIPAAFRRATLRVYNEWYKHPENPDQTVWAQDGEPAVPLSAAWSRTRFNNEPENTEDYISQAVGNDQDVRILAETQARFRSAMEREVLSYNRYMELIGEMYDAQGSREVDQVPFMLDQVEIGVQPREIPATDGPSLGQWQSLFDFGLDHQIRGVTAPEHCVLTYILTVRFAPIIESVHPMANNRLSWAERVGDPDILGSMPPQPVQIQDVQTGSSSTDIGYLPAGWQWRAGHDVIGRRIDERDSFPYMQNLSAIEHTKDATRIKDAFRVQALGHYVCDAYITEDSRNVLSAPLESYFSGMKGAGSKAEFPKQGKML
jgi:hypothetical protein